MQLFRDRASFFLGEGHLTARRGHAVAREDGFGLVLVNLHGASAGARIGAARKRASLHGNVRWRQGRETPVILDALEVISRGTNLSRAEADAAMEEILAGRAEDGQIVALLAGLREKGETIEELVGFATAMRRRAAPVFSAPRELTRERLVDTCGTGGDARGTFNISTCAAFVAAGAGARVAK